MKSQKRKAKQKRRTKTTYNKEYYLKNRERLLGHSLKYNAAHREERREYARAYHEKNKKKVKAKAREVYLRDRVGILAALKERYRNDPELRERQKERCREYGRKMRAKKIREKISTE